MFKVFGNDGQVYGPVPADTLREWVRQGRANARTQVMTEDASTWQPLSAFPEFQSDLAPGSVASQLPKTSGMAIASLVLGVLGVVSCGFTSLVGLVLGIVAWVKINKSQGRLTGNGFAIAGIATSAVFILLIPIFVAMMLPAFAKGKSKSQAIACMNSMRQMSIAVNMYASSHSNSLPEPTIWCDLLTTNGVLMSSSLSCPGFDGSGFGYAYNSNLAGMSYGKVNPQTVMFFESDIGWNASGGADAMISVPRHGGVFNVGFADGSVRQMRPSQTNTLRWRP